MADTTTLDEFRDANAVKGKGSLAVVLQLTRAFSKDSLPIDPDDYKTEKQGQVAGLGGNNLKAILESHGINAEGRAGTLSELVALYNGIIDEFETDPSLRIDLRG